MNHPYATSEYASALSHWGRALYVPEWNTHVLIRKIKPGIEDAAGTYPIAILDKNADIPGGLEYLRRHQLLSVVLVLDDFHRPALSILKKYFLFVKKFKTHYIHNNQKKKTYTRHHQHELLQSLKSVRISPFDLKNNLQAWVLLYDNLIRSKNLTGLHAFPLKHHAILSKLNGITAIGAWQDSELISCHIWVDDGISAHSHLAASSTTGYKNRAAYAINDASIAYFSNTQVINFGGGLGINNKTVDGLTKFKQGFSNSTTCSYICGAVLNEKSYAKLIAECNITSKIDFFPAYRSISK